MRNIKKTHTVVRAYELGQNTNMEKQLLIEGKIIRISEEQYQVFSQEATSGPGEIGYVGDYIKIDRAGFPYVNTREFFESNHRWIQADEYEQIAKPLQAWKLGDPQDEIIDYLIQEKDLTINPADFQKCFSAPLWGTVLTADQNAVIIVYKVFRDNDGIITDVDFCFVAGDEFRKTYQEI